MYTGLQQLEGLKDLKNWDDLNPDQQAGYSRLDPKLSGSSEYRELVEIFANLEPGQQSVDVSFRDEVMREIIWRQSDLLATILKGIPSISTKDLHHQVQWAGDLEGEFDIPEFANAGFERALVSREFTFLKKWEVAWYHSWEQFAHDRPGEMLQHLLKKAADARRKVMDDRGLEMVYQGADNTAAAIADWNGTSAIRNPPYDVAVAENTIFYNSNVTEEEMDNMMIIYPSQCRGSIRTELRDINGSDVTWKEYFGKLGYEAVPTRQPSLYGSATSKYGARDAALVFVKGPDTARFFHYGGHPKIPFVQIETTRAGITYTIRDWFECFVIPISTSDPDNKRIYTITDVVV